MFGFNSWSDLTKKAQESLKTVAEQTKVVSTKLSEQAKTTINKAATNVNNFIEEQKIQYKQLEHDAELQQRRSSKKKNSIEHGLPPWYIQITDKNEHQKELIPEVKLRILKLCEDENNFLISAPSSQSVFPFCLDTAIPYANTALQEDPILAKIRFELVPKKIKEPEFWKNYFYRIQLIREAMGLNKLDLNSLPIVKDEFMQIQEIEINNNNNNNMKEKNEINEHENVSIFEQSQSTPQQVQQTLSSHSSPRPPKDQMIDNNTIDNNNNNTQQTSSPFAVIDNDQNPSQNQSNNLITGNGHIKENDEKHGGNGEEEVDYFASDDPHIDHLTDEQKIKMKQELGLHNHSNPSSTHNHHLHDNKISEKHDSHDMDALLADVEGVSDISEGELENVVNEVNDM